MVGCLGGLVFYRCVGAAFSVTGQTLVFEAFSVLIFPGYVKVVFGKLN